MYPLDWYGPKVRRYMCPENYLRPYQDDRIEVGTYLIEKTEDIWREELSMGLRASWFLLTLLIAVMKNCP